MSYLEALRELRARKNGAKHEMEVSKASKGAFEPFEVAHTGNWHRNRLPSEVRSGLDSLRWRRRPRLAEPELWSAIVADALLIARSGWAERALANGWHPRDLWGCVPGDPDSDGLAVWLRGQRLALIDDSTAIAIDASRRRVFHRRLDKRSVYLWNL